MKRVAAFLILIPIGIIIISLAVANRQEVVVAIPPQIGDAPLYTFTLPLFALVFGAVIVGLVVGGFATWIRQGKHRKRAREQKVKASKMEFEAKKQTERADALVETLTSEQKALGALGLTKPSNAA